MGSFNAKPLVAGSSYRWYTQVEYSVAAGRKRAGNIGNDLKEIRVMPSKAEVVVKSEVVVYGLNAKMFEEGKADFVLAVAAELGLSASKVEIIEVLDLAQRKRSSGVKVVDEEQESSVKSAVGNLGENLGEGLTSWNPALFGGKSVGGAKVLKVERTGPVVVAEGGNNDPNGK